MPLESFAPLPPLLTIFFFFFLLNFFCLLYSCCSGCCLSLSFFACVLLSWGLACLRVRALHCACRYSIRTLPDMFAIILRSEQDVKRRGGLASTF
ncbi:hypothetical protein, unknown function [Leishmania braziliensis MHOM/BR/75/M2904]|uniref:Uncharacterized protein n=1 Tax=Leishmania braziliensis TaxID=5660 RepID=A4HAY1_LEIBR|nr:hypothetical protein, unknown function [Leishmania braziliensis MHOM/BR/75/M2904]CAM38566.1 hypothetical protein, unknown function [Leishmania braziliensis MHOM/BR/75/M2904]